MKDLYLTIESPVQGQFRDKGSRFIAFAFPVNGEEEIKQRIDELKKEYHDARHHCFAWRLGADMERYRVNDDGEPSGSAGKPIFGQIKARGLTQILVVVVRYFGGTLLGVGGLIRAYRSATSDALESAVVVERKVEDQIILKFQYPSLNRVMKTIKDFDLQFEKQQFDMDCSVTLRVWKRHIPALMKRVSEIEGCRVSPG
ncbi:MAG: YigZ family protein [Bacteroidota bacterium]